MFIAHAPSGYILAASILKRTWRIPASAAATIASAMAGAVAPDLDFVYFFLVDHRQTLHHRYISHWPLSWLTLSIVAAIWLRASPRSKSAFLLLLFCLGGVLHVILDSVVGDVFWFAPFIYKPYSLFSVRALWHPWWLNFIVHWSFALELAICGWALLLYRQRRAAANLTS